jgi:hypothetical protein
MWENGSIKWLIELFESFFTGKKKSLKHGGTEDTEKTLRKRRGVMHGHILK